MTGTGQVASACVAALLTLMMMAGGGHADDAIRITLRVKNQNDVQELRCRNSEIKVETVAGELDFELVDLEAIIPEPGTDKYHVQTSDGSTWLGQIGDLRLSYRFLDETRRLLVPEGQLITLVTRAGDREQSSPHGEVKLLLTDGSHTLLNTERSRLEVESACGQWEMPIGALKAIKILPGRSDSPRILIARFFTGHVERLLLRETGDIHFTDNYGNKLRVPIDNVKGILNGIATVEPVIARADETLFNRAHIIDNDGSGHDITMPSVVLEMASDAGRLAIPSQSIMSIAYIKRERAFRCQTVFGDLIEGRITPRTLNIPLADSDTDMVALDLSDCREIRIAEAQLQIPEGWHVWHLRSGERLVGRFADGDALHIGASDIVQPTKTLNALIRDTNGNWVAVLRSGKTQRCTTAARKVGIIALVNGMRTDVAWSSIVGIHGGDTINGTVPEIRIDELEPATMPVVRTDEAHESERIEDAELRFRTSGGTARLPRSRLHAIVYSPELKCAVVLTTFGDRLPTASLDLGDMGIESDRPPDQTGEILLQVRSRENIGAAKDTCQLRDGTTLVGTLVDQAINVYASEGSRERVDVQSGDIVLIRRNETMELVVELTNARVLGAPRDRQFVFAVASVAKTNTIRFADIDYVHRSGATSRPRPPQSFWSRNSTVGGGGQVRIEGGTFSQGSRDGEGYENERPQHNVTLEAILMDPTEVTRAQFGAFTEDTGYQTLAEQQNTPYTWLTPGFQQGADHPAVCISWYDAIEYCNWRSKQCGLTPCYTIHRNGELESDLATDGFRLPTESEWEYIARHGTARREYPWDGSSPRRYEDGEMRFVANYRAPNGESGDLWEWTNPVQSCPDDGRGLFGLGGNVWEWCQDWYFDRAYASRASRTSHSPCLDTNGAGFYTHRVMRGGSFKNHLDLLRAANRGHGAPAAFSNHVGFRCVRNAPRITALAAE